MASNKVSVNTAPAVQSTGTNLMNEPASAPVVVEAANQPQAVITSHPTEVPVANDPSQLKVYTVQNATQGPVNVKHVFKAINQADVHNVIAGPNQNFAVVGGSDLNTAVFNRHSFVKNPQRAESLEQVLVDWKGSASPCAFYSDRPDVDFEMVKYLANPGKYVNPSPVVVNPILPVPPVEEPTQQVMPQPHPSQMTLPPRVEHVHHEPVMFVQTSTPSFAMPMDVQFPRRPYSLCIPDNMQQMGATVDYTIYFLKP